MRACAASTPNGDEGNKMVGKKKDGGWKIEFTGEKPLTRYWIQSIIQFT